MVILSCAGDENPSPQSDTPIVTAIGTANGQASSSSIGPSGGTLQSVDGNLSVIIPQGALSSATTITIQPITNEGPLGLGSAYRLEPEGLAFAKQVKLQFHYSDALLDGIPADFLWIITQSANGGWNAMLHAEIDTNAKTVSVHTNHFSDWTLGKFIDLSISPASSVLKKNQSVQLKVAGFVRDQSVKDEDELAPLIAISDTQDELTPLTPIPPVESRFMTFRIKQWMLNGLASPVSNNNGSLSGSKNDATYTAPGKKPDANPVSVSVQLESSNKEGAKSSYILNSSISIVEDDLYLIVKIDGVSYEYYQYGLNGGTPPDPNNYALANCTFDENTLALVGSMIHNNIDLTNLFGVELKGPFEGTRPFTCFPDGDDDMGFIPAMGSEYVNERAIRKMSNGDCYDEYSCADISFTLLTFENTFLGKVRGYFSGTVYEDKPSYPNDCKSSDAHTIEGEFNLLLVKE
jgi:hypothetical protein